MSKREKTKASIFAIYGVMMLVMLFARPLPNTDMPYWECVKTHFNPVPFDTIIYFFRILQYDLSWGVYYQVLANLIGNVVLFIPLGFFLPGIRKVKHGFFKTMGIAALIIIAVELLQMFTLLGYCDIDDLILNLAGVAIGYAMRKAIAA